MAKKQGGVSRPFSLWAYSRLGVPVLLRRASFKGRGRWVKSPVQCRNQLRQRLDDEVWSCRCALRESTYMVVPDLIDTQALWRDYLPLGVIAYHPSLCWSHSERLHGDADSRAFAKSVLALDLH